MNKGILLLALVITIPSYAATNSYADKCAELIEHSKSPTANWTTSIQEAAMAGECLGVIKTITTHLANMRIRSSTGYSSSTQRYRCKSGSIIEHATRIVNRNAVTIEHVVDELCELK